MAGGMTWGAAKLHLHEAELPAFEAAVAFVSGAHATGRPAAIHCATEVELVFALAAIAEAGAAPGDRIEHASVAPDSAVGEIARLGLAVVTQPHFIAERGDTYRAEVAPALHPILYRLRAFRNAGVTLAAGSDAPFGGTDPWTAMQAATSRQTRAGAPLGAAEALTPEAALDLYLGAPRNLAMRRRVEAGAPADLCLLDRPWSRARMALGSVQVRATVIGGRVVHDARPGNRPVHDARPVNRPRRHETR
jgi:predicted amidohydrolase YtcJ